MARADYSRRRLLIALGVQLCIQRDGRLGVEAPSRGSHRRDLIYKFVFTAAVMSMQLVPQYDGDDHVKRV